MVRRCGERVREPAHGDAGVEKNRQVAAHGRIARHFAVLGHARDAGPGRFQLENDARICQVEGLLDLRMQSAEPANRPVSTQDPRRLAGMQRRVRRRHEAKLIRRTCTSEHRLDVATHVIEVDGARLVTPLPGSTEPVAMPPMHSTSATAPACETNFVANSNNRTRGCCRRWFSTAARTRPGHSVVRITARSDAIGLLSISCPASSGSNSLCTADRRSCT
jgi:hypothetical protein